MRPARVDDAAEIARVHLKTWRAAYAHLFPADFLAGLSLEERELRWRQILESDEATPVTIVAVADGQIVGFASVGRSRDEDAAGAGELYAIYVDPSVWDKGIGRGLATEAERLLRASSFDLATLWVLEDNPRARRFYEAGGWIHDGGRRGAERGGVEAAEIRYRKHLRA